MPVAVTCRAPIRPPGWLGRPMAGMARAFTPLATSNATSHSFDGGASKKINCHQGSESSPQLSQLPLASRGQSALIANACQPRPRLSEGQLFGSASASNRGQGTFLILFGDLCQLHPDLPERRQLQRAGQQRLRRYASRNRSGVCTFIKRSAS